MFSNRVAVSRLCVFASILALGFTAIPSHGQTASLAAPRVLGPVDESQMVTVKDDVLPLAQARFDQGLVPDGTPTGHMMMVLKRSDEQQHALEQWIASQQDPKSPNYHKWLTPEQFGAQFGVGDADVEAVTSYLASQGFAVGRIFKGKMAIEFSGTTGQVRSAFHTEIHSYTVNGHTFHANAKAPQIPAALAPVIRGVSLTNYKAPSTSTGEQMVLDRKTGTSHPLYTDITNLAVTVSPGDLAAIYDIPASATGSGVTVGVISDSNINVAIPANYRTLFGLPANAPTVVVDGTDPGVTTDAPIATAQIELLAATAPLAKVNLYTAADTDLDTGIDFATIRAVDDNHVQVLVLGAEGCEANLGPVVNVIFAESWEQAAAEGISVVVGSGTGGAAECDAVPFGTAPPAAASNGLAVNGYASTPWDTAVGASDFYYGPAGTVAGNPSILLNYWNATNGGTAGFTSAKSYIPEQPYNSSFQATNQQTSTPVAQATGGGASTAGQTGADGVTQIPYPLPAYQAAIGITGSARIIPDVSFFGAAFNNYSAYMLCIDASDCVNGTPSSVQYTRGLGNSALAASAFAGIAADIVQAHGVQGYLNNGLYATYKATPSAFHDITVGTNKVACTSGSPDCVGGYTSTGSGAAYNATTGYDPASGLGSVDVAKLISNWTSGIGSGTPTVKISITRAGVPVTSFAHDDPTVDLTVTATGGAGTPTGDVSFTGPANGNASQTLFFLTLDSTGTGTYPFGDIAGLIPGGTYSLTARYGGDSNYAPTVASIPVTVSPVPGKLVTTPLDPAGNPLPVYNGQTIPYGTNVRFSFSVSDANDPNDPWSASGFITLSDNGKQLTILPLNSEGSATFASTRLAAGSHSFSATYNGDGTYTAATLSGAGPSLVIGGIATATTLTSTLPTQPSANNQTELIATVTPSVPCVPGVPCAAGAAPSGSVQFKTSTGTLLGTVTLDLGQNAGSAPSSTAVLTLGQDTFPLGSTTTVIANYVSNTANYTGSTSNSVTLTNGNTHGLLNTTAALKTTPANAINFVDTSTLTFTATISNAVSGGYAKPSGTVTFFSNGTQLGTAPLTVDGLSRIATFTIPMTNGILNLPTGQSRIVAQYDGDSSHAASSAVYTVNVYDATTTPDFAMQSNLLTQTISGGGTANFTLQFSSMNNFSALNVPITLSYTASAAGITCTGTPTSPSFNGGLYANVSVSCSAGASAAVTKRAAAASPSRLWIAGGGAAFACIFLFGMAGRRRKWHSLIGSLALIVVAFGVTGCGVNVAGGPQQNYYDSLESRTAPTGAATLAPGTYTVVVTGTAAVFTKSQTNTTVNVVHNLPLRIVVQ